MPPDYAVHLLYIPATIPSAIPKVLSFHYFGDRVIASPGHRAIERLSF
jgi:hypothetical protein